MKILTLEDIMEETGLSYKAVYALVNTKGCPLLPRVKNAPYRVPADPFFKWLGGFTKQ